MVGAGEPRLPALIAVVPCASKVGADGKACAFWQPGHTLQCACLIHRPQAQASTVVHNGSLLTELVVSYVPHGEALKLTPGFLWLLPTHLFPHWPYSLSLCGLVS